MTQPSLPAAMTAIVVETPGGPDALVAASIPLPELAPGDVLIRVAAAGLNGADLSQRRGNYAPPPGAVNRIGLEVSGKIVAVGADAGRWRPGDRVVALTNGGGYAEYAAVPHSQVLPLPSGWSLVEGAALPETFFTVMQALVMRTGLASGMTVLCHGGASGIGGTVITIGNILGARTLAVVSSAEKAAYAMAMGAAATIDRTTEDIVARTRELTDGRGADRIVDMVGGPTTVANLDAAAVKGQIVMIALPAGGTAELSLAKIVMRELSLHGSRLRPQTSADKAAVAARLRADVWPALAQPATPRPRIRTFALADAASAHVAMESAAHFGKILLVSEFGQSSEN